MENISCCKVRPPSVPIIACMLNEIIGLLVDVKLEFFFYRREPVALKFKYKKCNSLKQRKNYHEISLGGAINFESAIKFE